MFGGGVDQRTRRIYYRGERTKQIQVLGTSQYFAQVGFIPLEAGRFFTAPELRHGRAVVVLGYTPFQSLFPFTDPIGKKVRIGGATVHRHRRDG